VESDARFARRLSRDGALVAVHYGKRREAADETVREIESGSGAAFAVGADLGSLSGVQALYRALAAALRERTGDTQLDIHFNQVGGPRHDPVGRS
jgi:3-oxoacyl-[acyl-carrier protein] reductase